MADCVRRKLASNKELKEKNVVNDLLRKGIRVDADTKAKAFKIVGYKTKFAAGINAKMAEKLLDEI